MFEKQSKIVSLDTISSLCKPSKIEKSKDIIKEPMVITEKVFTESKKEKPVMAEKLYIKPKEENANRFEETILWL